MIIWCLVTLALTCPGVVLISVIALVVAGFAANASLDIERTPNPVPLVELIPPLEGWATTEHVVLGTP
jgi:hypothetical protein